MSFVSMSEINQGRQGSDEQAKGQASKTRTKVYRVIMSSPTDTADTVLANCPILCSPYPGNSSFALIHRHAAPESAKNKLVWIVTLTYNLIDASFGPLNPLQQNPLNDLPQSTWRTVTTQEPTWEDYEGNAILNSAGQYFENGVKRDWMTWQVTIVRNVQRVPLWINTFLDSINESPCVVDGVQFGAYQCKLQSLEISRWQQRNGVLYRSLTLVIGIRDDWRRYILDEGMLALDNNPASPTYGKPVPAVLANGQKATRPVPLDGNGHVLANPTPGTCKFITVNLYLPQNFNLLPIS